MPQSSKIDIRDRRQLLFVSYSSSLSLIYPSLLLEDTISAVKWTKRDPESRNQYLRISRAQIFAVRGLKGTDECQWQRKFICQRNEQVAIWNSEYEPGVWLTFVGRIVWCVLPLSKFRQWIKDQKGEKVRCRSGAHLSTPDAFDFCSRLSCIAFRPYNCRNISVVGPTHLFS